MFKSSFNIFLICLASRYLLVVISSILFNQYLKLTNTFTEEKLEFEWINSKDKQNFLEKVDENTD